MFQTWRHDLGLSNMRKILPRISVQPQTGKVLKPNHEFAARKKARSSSNQHKKNALLHQPHVLGQLPSPALRISHYNNTRGSRSLAATCIFYKNKRPHRNPSGELLQAKAFIAFPDEKLGFKLLYYKNFVIQIFLDQTMVFFYFSKWKWDTHVDDKKEFFLF